MPKHNDYYAILNVLRDASEDEIRKAYRQLALKYHPDKNPGDKMAETKFREAKDAYELLCNVLERSCYDQHNSPEPGRDLEYSLEVALKNGEDSSRVPVEEITFEAEGRKIRLTLDKGDGRYRLRGAGGAGAFGGTPGDLFVIVNADTPEPDVQQTILGNYGAEANAHEPDVQQTIFGNYDTEMVLIPAGQFLMGSTAKEQLPQFCRAVGLREATAPASQLHQGEVLLLEPNSQLLSSAALIFPTSHLTYCADRKFCAQCH